MPIEKSGLGVVVRVGSRETYLGMPEWNEIGEHFAALRSDSPVRDGLHPFWVKLDEDGMVDGGFHTESGPGLTKVWMDVGDRPSSTGGERDDADPYDIGYDTGFKDGMHAGRQEIPEGGIEVEVDSMLAAGKEWSKIYVPRSTPYIEPGSYILLPRQVGDPTDEQERDE